MAKEQRKSAYAHFKWLLPNRGSDGGVNTGASSAAENSIARLQGAGGYVVDVEIVKLFASLPLQGLLVLAIFYLIRTSGSQINSQDALTALMSKMQDESTKRTGKIDDVGEKVEKVIEAQHSHFETLAGHVATLTESVTAVTKVAAGLLRGFGDMTTDVTDAISTSTTVLKGAVAEGTGVVVSTVSAAKSDVIAAQLPIAEAVAMTNRELKELMKAVPGETATALQPEFTKILSQIGKLEDAVSAFKLDVLDLYQKTVDAAANKDVDPTPIMNPLTIDQQITLTAIATSDTQLVTVVDPLTVPSIITPSAPSEKPADETTVAVG